MASKERFDIGQSCREMSTSRPLHDIDTGQLLMYLAWSLSWLSCPSAYLTGLLIPAEAGLITCLDS